MSAKHLDQCASTLIKSRVQHLEWLAKNTFEALQVAASMNNLNASVSTFKSPVTILQAATTRLKELITFDSYAFFLADKDSDLPLALCEPAENAGFFKGELDRLIDDGTIPDVLNNKGPLFKVKPKRNGSYLLHSVATTSRIRGLYIGDVGNRRKHIQDISLFSLTIVLNATASLLESYELYKMLRQANTKLKKKITNLRKEVALRKKTESSLVQSQRMLNLVMDNIPQSVFWKGTDLCYLGCNKNFAASVGYGDPSGVIGKTDQDLPFKPEEAARFQASDKRVIRENRCELDIQEPVTLADTSTRWLETNRVPMHDGQGRVIGVLGTSHDITERKAYDDQLSHLALHDALTGLPNRVLFFERLSWAMSRSKRNTQTRSCVLLMDMDRFKQINDAHGHLLGDRLLVELSKRISRCLRESDILSRLGGDEFTIMIEDIARDEDYTAIVERIVVEIEKPFNILGRVVYTSVSIGVVEDIAKYTNPEDILRDADIAMYAAKGFGGRRVEVYKESMHESVIRVTEMEHDLHYGFDHNEFSVVYQPIFSIPEHTLRGFEVLARWTHSKLGPIGPDVFIPLAEKTGLILELGAFVLHKACTDFSRWRAQFPEQSKGLYLSINLSARQLSNPDLVAEIKGILAANDIPPELINLEITESMVMQDPDNALAILRHLKQLGVGIFLDDFGTGYSSLSHLQKFPIDTLKIDKSFIFNLSGGKSMESTAIVRSILALGGSLGMQVVAEGIENISQRDSLVELGCTTGQGYLMSRPLPAEKVVSHMADM
ncbi:MAG: EAL domain-containing protein [Desulfovibrio sp.]|nr:EAL domain-containing protein [Desulfovibrio sp.]MBI4961242.1 EAL domain-containing protein [Desulfovibrio sp.]